MPRRRNSRSAAPVVDKISTLPDEILCRILSFVTTKEAVSTSVLSKRWTHLCHRVPNLRFTNIKVNTVQSTLRFNQSVYSVLISRETAGSNSINEFHLHIQYGNPSHGYRHGFPHVMKWIKLFVQRSLEHLHLHVDGIHTKLPISIFTCTTLVSLYLCGFYYVEFSSNGFQFPSLKTLHLVTIMFSEVKDFVLLIAGCPILEDLE
ncbi:F-box/LRR-repeat protein, partial [Trifolium medium]|nr:F-box/LRR-repeat protein [Trifolium medium]